MAPQPGAESARRAVELLFAFEREPISSVRRLAELTDIPVPSAHRYVAMLREMGLVEEARHGEYRLTLRVDSLGRAARGATSLLEIVQPFLNELHEETGETVLLIQAIGGLPVCVHRVESRGRLRLSFETGQPLPALRGASAHLVVGAIDAGHRRRHIEEQIAHGSMPPLSGVDGFLAEVERDAARGWAVSAEEIDEGIWSAAAAVTAGGEFFGTVSVPCPKFRVDEATSQAIVQAVRRASTRISAALAPGL